MTGLTRTAIKFGVFGIVMVLLTTALFFIFGQYRTGSTAGYSAIFADASRLKPGDSVRVAGIRVGTVDTVTLNADNKVHIGFDVDRNVPLTIGTRAAVRYLNLVGDRYLELIDGPGSTRLMAGGAEIPIDRTAPALDLDLLLGGLKPVIRGLNPRDVNALTSSILQVLQGQGGTVQSLLDRTASFSNAIADNDQNVEHLIDNLQTVVDTLAKDGDKFSGAIDRLEQLVSGIANDRDPIGTAIESLSNGTASISDLLAHSRAPLGKTVEQLARLAPLLDEDKQRLDEALQKAPENYRKLVRLGSYGSFYNFYICGVSIRVTDLQGRTAMFPWLTQDTGRCADS